MASKKEPTYKLPRERAGTTQGTEPKRQRAVSAKTLLANKVENVGGMMPLDYMLRVMRNSKLSVELRLDAARAAAPYKHPRLAQVDHTVGNKDGKPFQIVASVGDSGML